MLYQAYLTTVTCDSKFLPPDEILRIILNYIMMLLRIFRHLPSGNKTVIMQLVPLSSILKVSGHLRPQRSITNQQIIQLGISIAEDKKKLKYSLLPSAGP